MVALPLLAGKTMLVVQRLSQQKMFKRRPCETRLNISSMPVWQWTKHQEARTLEWLWMFNCKKHESTYRTSSQNSLIIQTWDIVFSVQNRNVKDPISGGGAS